jgi:hypothetical protein
MIVIHLPYLPSDNMYNSTLDDQTDFTLPHVLISIYFRVETPHWIQSARRVKCNVPRVTLWIIQLSFLFLHFIPSFFDHFHRHPTAPPRDSEQDLRTLSHQTLGWFRDISIVAEREEENQSRWYVISDLLMDAWANVVSTSKQSLYRDSGPIGIK